MADIQQYKAFDIHSFNQEETSGIWSNIEIHQHNNIGQEKSPNYSTRMQLPRQYNNTD